MSGRLALFAYGSLVDPASAALTLGRPVPGSAEAELPGWRRRFSQGRRNRDVEKTFATPSGEIPGIVLGLNLEPAPSGSDAATQAPNGVLIGLTPAELELLDRRELRYSRADVTGAVASAAAARFDTVFTYVAKPEHHTPTPPAGAVIIAAYARAVEAAFAGLSAAALERYRATTLPYPAPLVEGVLVADRIQPGNPREW